MIKELLMASALICAYPQTHQVKNAIDLNVQQHKDYNSKYIQEIQRNDIYGNNDGANVFSDNYYFNALYIYDYLNHLDLSNGRVISINLEMDLFYFTYDSTTNEFEIYWDDSNVLLYDLDINVLPSDTWNNLHQVGILKSFTYIDTSGINKTSQDIWNWFANPDAELSNLDIYEKLCIADDVVLPFNAFSEFPVYCANFKEPEVDNMYSINGVNVYGLNYHYQTILFNYVDTQYLRNIFAVVDVQNIGVSEYLRLFYSWSTTNYNDIYEYQYYYYYGGYLFDNVPSYDWNNNRYGVTFNKTLRDISFVSKNELFVGLYISKTSYGRVSIDYIKMDGSFVAVYNGVSNVWLDDDYRYIYSFSGNINGYYGLILENTGVYGNFIPVTNYDITNLIYDYANLPFFLMQRLFSFSIFGVQVWSLILSLITILLAIFVIRKVSK